MLPQYDSLVPGRLLQLSSKDVHPALGDVNLKLDNGKLRVSFTVLMSPGSTAEGWRTAVALDCSDSMRSAYGGDNAYFSRELTEQEKEQFSRDGMLLELFRKDGQEMCRLSDEAYESLLQNGLLHKEEEPNDVQNLCRKFIPLLAGELDAEASTLVIRHSLGSLGSDVSVAGVFTEANAETLDFRGPDEQLWGNGSSLLPALRFMLNRFSHAAKGFFVMVTDGHIDDFDAVCAFTEELSRDIRDGKARPVKFVLVGAGYEPDEARLAELDALADSRGLPVDIWDYKMAEALRSPYDIFAEAVDENEVVAPVAEIYDDLGHLVHKCDDGLRARMEFELPRGAKRFVISLPDGGSIEQALLAD